MNSSKSSVFILAILIGSVLSLPVELNREKRGSITQGLAAAGVGALVGHFTGVGAMKGAAGGVGALVAGKVIKGAVDNRKGGSKDGTNVPVDSSSSAVATSDSEAKPSWWSRLTG